MMERITAIAIVDDIKLLHAMCVPTDAIARRLRIPARLVREVDKKTDADTSPEGKPP
jgi:hypothetical protein